MRVCAVVGCDTEIVGNGRICFACQHRKYGLKEPLEVALNVGVCVVCGKEFVKLSGRSVACPDPCQAERAAEMKRANNRERERRFYEENGYYRSRKWEQQCRETHLEGARRRRHRAAAVMPMRERYPEAHAARDARRRAAKAGADVIERVLRQEVFDRDGWICQLCMEPVDPTLEYPDPSSKSLDHIMPLSWGGDHSYENTQLAHLFCNVAKGDKFG